MQQPHGGWASKSKPVTPHFQTHRYRSTVSRQDSLEKLTSTSHWIRILIEKGGRPNGCSTKQLVSSVGSLLCWCTVGYSACLPDWHPLWFSRQTTNWHQWGLSVLSHGGSVCCGREQRRLSTLAVNKPLSSVFYRLLYALVTRSSVVRLQRAFGNCCKVCSTCVHRRQYIPIYFSINATHWNNWNPI